MNHPPLEGARADNAPRRSPVLLGAAQRFVLSVVLFQFLFTVLSYAASGEVHITFLANPTDYHTTPGHAFLVVSIHTSNGPKEEAFGFYPRAGGKTFVGWPGAVESQFRRNPDSFSRVTASFTREITLLQYYNIGRIMQAFNRSDYSLLETNCIDLVDSVARSISLKTPVRAVIQTPVAYVKELARLNADVFEIRLYNADDLLIASLNGTEVARAGFRGDTGRQPLKTKQGDNALEIALYNDVLGVAWGYQVYKNGKVIISDQCGQANVRGCYDKNYPKGLIWKRSFNLRADY